MLSQTQKTRYLLYIILFATITVILVLLLKPKNANLTKQLPKSLPQTQKETVNTTNLKIAEGFSIDLFATDLGSPRDLEISPEGILLASIPQEGKIVALEDSDNNGKSEKTSDVLTKLNRPHGISFHEGKLFVTEETAVARYAWNGQTLKATLEKKLFDLPKGGRHFSRTIDFDKSGRMYISLGSTCDVCYENHEFLAAVIVSDPEGTNPRLFASGLRNAVFITVNPQTDELWATEMGRDFLGDNLPPDEINIIREGKDYGWPLCYGSRVHDTDFDKKVYIQIVPQPPCAETEPPVYEIPAHSAPLGLAFDKEGDLLVAYHGSWNRSTPIGYKVVKLDVRGNEVAGEEDFLTGFLPAGASGPSQADGRPADLIFDPDGSLYISDDKAGVIYRVWK